MCGRADVHIVVILIFSPSDYLLARVVQVVESVAASLQVCSRCSCYGLLDCKPIARKYPDNFLQAQLVTD